MIDHLLVSVNVQLLEAGVLTFDLETQAGGEIFFVADHDIDVLSDFLIDFLALFKAADCGPHRRAVVQVIGNNRTVFLRGLDRFNNGLAGLLGESSVNAAGVQPAYAELAENMLEIQIFRCCLLDCGVESVGAADRAAHAEASFREIEAVTADPADAVCLLPADQGSVNAALLDEILHESADFIVCECCQDSSIHAKTLVKTTDYIVFSAAFPCAEASGCSDSAFARIQTKHYLAEGNRVIPAFFRIFEI